MYVCLDCGRLYEEQPVIKERHGELDGNWYETLPDTCICGGNIEEAVQCKVCDDWHSEDDLVEGVCGYCLHRNLQADTVESLLTHLRLKNAPLKSMQHLSMYLPLMRLTRFLCVNSKSAYTRKENCPHVLRML